MFIHNYKNLVVLALVGWSSSIACQPLAAQDRIVPASCPAAYAGDACGPTLAQSFRRKLRLHAVYARRNLSQRYVVLPASEPSGQAACPPNAAGGPYAQPAIGGYSSPPPISGPAGVYIR